MTTTFLIMTDTHFMDPGAAKDTTWWNRMLKTQSSGIADSIISTVTGLAPDFVIHCGDITDNGTHESFYRAKEIMDQLGCPYYLALGNHDTFLPGTRKSIAELFENDAGRFFYSRTLDGFRVIVLDCAYWVRKDGEEDEAIDWDAYRAGEYLGIGPSEEELDWLTRELTTDAATPSIVVCHPPLSAKATYPVGSLPGGIPVRQAPSPYGDFASLSYRYEKLVEALASAEAVKVVLAGHWHIFDTTLTQRIYHCQTGSLIEYPFEMRLARVTDGHLSISTVGLDDQSFRKASKIEELRNRWVEGECGDRDLEIDLI